MGDGRGDCLCARDANLAVSVRDLDFGKLRFVEQFGERADKSRIDVDALLFMVTHETLSCCYGAPVLIACGVRTPVRMAPSCPRSEARRVGKELCSTCSSAWSPYL